METILKTVISSYFNKSNNNNDIDNKNENDYTPEDRLKIISSDNYTINDFENILKLKYENFIDIQENIFNDLEYFSNNDINNIKTIFNKINFTYTSFGNICKTKILINPIKSIDKLKLRQKFVKNIIKLDEDKKKSLNDTLNNIKLLEKDIIWFWKHSNSSHLDVLCEMVYFNITNLFLINDKLNSNTDLLSISNIYSIYLNPIITISSPIISVLIPLIIFWWIKKKANIKIPISTLFNFALKQLFNFNQFDMIVKNKFKARLLSLISTGLWVFFYIQNISTTVKNSKNINKVINLINCKVLSINKFLFYIKHLSTILDFDSKELADIFDIEFDFNNIINKFIYSLNRKKINSYNTKGILLKDFKIILNIKNDLSNLMKYVGIIDTINSNAILVDKYKYCFVEYLVSDKPVINLNNIYHPLIDNSIKNSININAKNLVITGPNAAGKSTFIKSLCINILFSQTLGLASCENFCMTPFKIIETYLHIPDINGVSSLFENEMNRSKNYINKIKLLNKDEFSFIIMDEIFSSTNHIEGASGAYAILKSLSKNKNNITIITTHYKQLIKLEKNTKKRFLNYKFEINRDKNGELNYDYKLKKGYTNQTIALELLKKNNFDNEIIEEAIEFSNKIKKEKKKKKK